MKPNPDATIRDLARAATTLGMELHVQLASDGTHPRGFTPTISHPVTVKIGGVEMKLSIASAETHMATVRALIAEARLREADEYLRYRLEQHAQELAVARLPKKKEKRP